MLNPRPINEDRFEISLSGFDPELRKKLAKIARQHKYVRDYLITKQGKLICLMKRPGRNETVHHFITEVVKRMERKVKSHQ